MINLNRLWKIKIVLKRYRRWKNPQKSTNNKTIKKLWQTHFIKQVFVIARWPDIAMQFKL
jgi:hypothetical protein